MNHNRKITKATKRAGPDLKAQDIRVTDNYPWLVLGAVVDCTSECLQSDEIGLVRSAIRRRDWADIDQLGELWSLQSMNSASPTGLAVFNWQAKVMLGSLIRKFRISGDNAARRDAAIQSFLKAETKCSMINRSLGRTLVLKPSILRHSQYFLWKLLGRTLPKEDTLTRDARHGPGASTSSVKRKTAGYFKYSQLPYHCTSRCLPHAKSLILSDARWLRALTGLFLKQHPDYPSRTFVCMDDQFWDWAIKLVPGNKITTVPKGRVIDRPIAIEPTLNMMLQLGLDGFIRRRLKRWGVNLDSQDKNRLLAFEGSFRMDAYAPVTIDLAAASDTVSLRICKILLPDSWFSYLCDLRSPSGVLPDGTKLRYRKMSSMGNGDTFGLESAIFTSIVYGVCMDVLGRFPRQDVAVFGDDIIVPSCVALATKHNLELAGFSLNKHKSFLKGFARESCGSDWFRAQPLRGVFLEEQPRLVGDIFCDRNRIFRWLKRRGLPTEPLDSLYRPWVPHKFRHLVGPCSDEEFDTYWHSPVPLTGTDPNGYFEGKKLHAWLKSDEGEKSPDFVLLQAPLKPLPPTQPYLKKRLGSAGGSVFDVPGNQVRRGVTRLKVFNWTIAYSPPSPLDP